MVGHGPHLVLSTDYVAHRNAGGEIRVRRRLAPAQYSMALGKPNDAV